MGMPIPQMQMHPGLAGIPQHDPMSFMIPPVSYPDLSSLAQMSMGTSGFHPSMFGPRPRRSRYSDLYGYSGGRGGSSRYLEPYDLFEDFFDGGDGYSDDYDDIDDPLMMFMRVARSGGGRRSGRRSRYGRYGGYRGYSRSMFDD